MTSFFSWTTLRLLSRRLLPPFLRCLPALGFLAFSLSARADNLLKDNPSFEEGEVGCGHGDFKFAGWTGTNWRWGYQGTKNAGAPGSGNRDFTITHGGILQTAPDSRAAVTGGEPYLLTFQCRKTMDDQPTFWLGLLPAIVFFDQAGTEVKTVWGQQVMSKGTSPWETIRLEGTAPENAVTAGVRISVDTGSYPHEDGRAFEVDDFSLTSITDPETLGFRRAARDLAPEQNAEVVVKYRTPDSADLLVRLVSGPSVGAEVRTSNIHGRGLVTLQVPIPKGTPGGDTYAWTARLVKPGASWETGGKVAILDQISVDAEVKTANSVPADDPHLVYDGRWEKDADGHPRALWQGSALLARFTGATFTLRYTYKSWDVSHRLKLRVLVDGTDLTPKDPLALPQGQNQFAVASNLSPGIHTIAVLRDGEEDTTLWEVDGVDLDQGAGLLDDHPFLNRKIEFYGDSTCSGGEGGMAVNYTKTTARALGAACSVVSKGATGISGGFVFKYNGLYYWDRFNFDVFYPDHGGDIPRNPYTARDPVDPSQSRGEPWGPGNFDKYGDPTSAAEIADKGHFADWPADAVVIGYGQNDQFGGGPFVENYRQFVVLLRKVYPHAHIFMTHTDMTGNESFLKSAMEPIVGDCGPGGLNADGKIHMMILHPTGNTNGNHPSIQNHQDLALGNKDWRGVVDWIEDTLGWSGTAENDPLETAAPGSSPGPGAYTSNETVALSSPTPHAVIHYTLDNSDPTPDSPSYDGPIALKADTTIKAIATSAGLPPSNVAVFTYANASAK